MRYLVTGGAGFIGSHLVEALLNEGHDVVSVDNFSAGRADNLPIHQKLVSINLDIGYLNAVSKSFFASAWAALNKTFDGVFHLAAEARIQPSIKDPLLAANANLLGMVQVLQFMRARKIFNIVYSSSSSVYGSRNKLPFTEDMMPDPLTPYGSTKLAGEFLCKSWGHSYGIRNTTLRYFNVYGERSPIHIGGYSPVIGRFFEQALSDKPITIIGDGQQRRDFTYVADVVDANIKAMADLQSKGECHNEVLNIGTGIDYSIMDVARKISRICLRYRSGVHIEHLPARPCEAKETLADIDKAKKLLDWKPRYTLDDALASLVFYHLSSFEVQSKEALA